MIEHCTLHIGTEKSGTTSIQAMLRANTHVWQRSGVHVSKEFGAANDRDFATYAMRDTRMDDARRRLKLDEHGALKRFRSEFRERVERELGNCRVSQLILSSEHFHSRLLHIQEVVFLKELLDQYCKNYTIICYIRPQHELAVSLYSTALRVGHTGFPLIPDVKKNPAYFDYDALLTRWSDVFGRQNVKVLIYGEQDSCASFRDVCSLPEPETIPARVNDALNGESQALLELFNHHLTGEARGNFPNLVAKVGRTPPNLPRRDEAEAFFAYHGESNERVRSAYFPARPSLFGVDFGKYPQEGRMTVLSEARLIELMSEIWALKTREHGALRQRNVQKR